MCILFIAIDQHKDHPLIIAANRDEFHPRPTQSAHFWSSDLNSNDNTILAGKDLQAGGTWLGVNKQGDFAALTNIRTGIKTNATAKSRGELVTLALDGKNTISPTWLTEHSDDYNPFNLIYTHNKQLFCFNSLQKKQQALTSGFHAICNGTLDDVWPKMAKGEQRLEQLIGKQQPITPQTLLTMMLDNEQAPEHLLPETGIGLEWEKMLSSIFIRSEEYGTRSTSIILKDQNQKFDFYEQSYKPDGTPFDSQYFNLSPLTTQ